MILIHTVGQGSVPPSPREPQTLDLTHVLTLTGRRVCTNETYISSSSSRSSAFRAPHHPRRPSSGTASTMSTTTWNHDLFMTVIVEPLVRVARGTLESSAMQQQRCSSPSGLWHPTTCISPALQHVDGGFNYHVRAAQQAPPRTRRRNWRVPWPHPSHEAGCQPENGTMAARRRRAMAHLGG
mgnify:CR=1 FL=1